MIFFLWRQREKPNVFSKRWVVVWGKRIINASGLFGIVIRRIKHVFNGTSVGDFTIIYGLEVNGPGGNLVIGGHTFIGRGVHFSTHAMINIGSFVCINDDVRLLSASHDVTDSYWRSFSHPIIIKDYAWIATGATIMPGITIGKGAVVGAGAVITKDLPDYAVAFGNPAQIRYDRRNQKLLYDPVIFAAPYEAWVGRNALLKMMPTEKS